MAACLSANLGTLQKCCCFDLQSGVKNLAIVYGILNIAAIAGAISVLAIITLESVYFGK